MLSIFANSPMKFTKLALLHDLGGLFSIGKYLISRSDIFVYSKLLILSSFTSCIAMMKRIGTK